MRRVTAVTGPGAVRAIQAGDRHLAELAELLHSGQDQLCDRVRALQEENKALRNQLEKGAAGDLKGILEQLLSAAEPISESGKLIVGEVPDVPIEQIRGGIDWIRQKTTSVAVLLGCRGDGKVMLIAGVTDDLVKAGLKAGDWVKQTAPIVAGKGGGRPNMAQAGGKDPEKLPEAIEAAKTFAREQLAG